ncbi:hypothetical protein BDW59DRAFT_168893 [Aspergillus cavernicola]|uniref:Homeobox and C2H2 transcription factor n=1 Tax=Aspergillus cavernicola TaxID=176166 RepID=A0ABR4J1W5_9EURO
MSRATVNILKKWFDQHPERPYPSKEEKLSLAGQTSVTVIQVSNWFANARRRQKYRFTRRGGPLNPAARRGSIELMRHGPTSLLSPLDRWRNSPPEAEAASLDAIMSAVVDSGQTNPSTRNFELQASSESTPYDNRSMDSSNASGSAVSNSPASSAYSFGSHSSNASFTQFYAAGPLRRRRRRTKPTSTLPKNTNPVGRDQRPYQCTFCTDTFRTKYDWTRHEKTLHLSLESYTCSPGGPTYTDSDGSTHCAFCDYPDPSENHLQSHSYDKCQEKPTVVRTFYRKDHLVQHLRLVHGINQLLPAMEGWKSQIDRVNSRCGFCSERFTSWSERNEHIAQHFRAGTLMSDWRGSRGIDPAVALAVENAMPPYLIGIESAAMNPFSATQMTDARLAPDDHTETGNMQRIGVKPTSFEFFTARITEFVREAQIAHETVTDSMIQTQARQIIFGDDDPWNQTPADNSEWLKLFKHGMGLDTVAAPSEEYFERGRAIHAVVVAESGGARRYQALLYGSLFNGST